MDYSLMASRQFLNDPLSQQVFACSFRNCFTHSIKWRAADKAALLKGGLPAGNRALDHAMTALPAIRASR